MMTISKHCMHDQKPSKFRGLFYFFNFSVSLPFSLTIFAMALYLILNLDR